MSTSMTFLDGVSSDIYPTSFSSNSSSSKAQMTGPAFESAVASYASRVLKKKCPPQSAVDASVGPYVTSTLRSALQAEGISTDWTTGAVVLETLPDYDSLMELLEEHCNMSAGVAKSALKSIVKALMTGVFDDDENRASSTYGSLGSSNGFSASDGFPGGHGRNYRSLSMGTENDFGGRRFRSFSMGAYDDLSQIGANSSVSSFGEFLNNAEADQNRGYAQASMIEEEPSFLFEEDEVPSQPIVEQASIFYENAASNSNTNTEEKMNCTSLPQSVTPLKPDRLIPVDLLGFMDGSFSNDEQKTETFAESQVESKASSKEASTLAEPTEPSTQTTQPPKLQEECANSDEISSRAGNRKKKTRRKDMDLAASLFTRPRSRSLHDIDKSPKLKPMAPPTSAMGFPSLNNASASAIMNNSIPALFEKQLDSAVQILMAMNYDICEEVAYEAASVSNADVNVAQHVIDGAFSAPPVCRHMLNGGCYRSDCQFSHDIDGHTCLFWLKGRCGKGEKCRFMHGFSQKSLDGVNVEFLKTQGASKGNQCIPPQSSTGTTNAIKTTNLVQHNMLTPFALPPAATKNSTNQIQPATHQGHESSEGGRSFSFAKIASKGYSEKSSFGFHEYSASNATNQEIKTVRIPQNLWNASYNRSSNAFHIADPIARYKEVSATTHRVDVIDLHFQSIKTFPAVLSVILPEKLRDHQEVWVVTGSGHHVSSNTHQKGGGVLENAVIGWLLSNNYNFMKGKDKNGFGGACLVKGRNR